MNDKKRIVVFSILMLIITVSFVLWNLDDYRRAKMEALPSATSIVIMNAKGESIELNHLETQELVDSMGSLPLARDAAKIKTQYKNKMRFYVDDKLIYELSFGMPIMFDKTGQVLIKNRPYRVNKSFYDWLMYLGEKYGFDLEAL